MQSRNRLMSSLARNGDGTIHARFGRGVNGWGRGVAHIPIGSSGSRRGAVQGSASAQTSTRGR